MARKKIAVLGGGVSAMTAVFEITSKPGWQDEYEIDVYQMGWRLGGKGASGRGESGRIEEHGLHIWMGFYENAFRVMRRVYAELGRPAGTPLATWQDAFKKHSLIGVEEHIDGVWHHWFLDYPENDDLPGDERPLPEPHGYFTAILRFVHNHLRMVREGGDDPAEKGQTPQSPLAHLWWDIHSLIDISLLTLGVVLLKWEQRRQRGTDNPKPRFDTPVHDHSTPPAKPAGPKPGGLGCRIVQWLKSRLRRRLRTIGAEAEEARRLEIIIELAFTFMQGIISDDLMSGPGAFDKIDDYDFREWLHNHGASKEACHSGPVQGLYDLVFAYHNGDTNLPCLAAGAALRSLLRIEFTYKGAIFWKMQASMGDTIFTPMYDVLKKRGVRFHFFNRVEKIKLAEGGRSVGAIELTEQVQLAEGVREYDPLIPVRGLPCWPSAPKWDLLKDGQALKEIAEHPDAHPAENVDLESISCTVKGAPKTLSAGTDFDHLILGIPVAAHPFVCPELVDGNPRWKEMCVRVETTRTLAMQLWVKDDLEQLGWKLGSPVLDAYQQPFNTWADMTFLLGRECWPAEAAPRSVAYFCGTMVGGLPDPNDAQAQRKANEEVRKIGYDWLCSSAAYLWPTGCCDGFDPSILVCPATNADAYTSQFWSANINPTERYTLTVAGSTKYRLKAGESGYDNVTLTGDWIHNGLNIGCVEASVMSGMQAANHVCGFPALKDIYGQFHP